MELTSKCPAFGCQSKPGKNLFCQVHWRKLPEDLRGPTSVKQAVVHLAKAEGYLVPAPRSVGPRLREDGKGREWV